jgi:hypothetical protein
LIYNSSRGLIFPAAVQQRLPQGMPGRKKMPFVKFLLGMAYNSLYSEVK